MQTTRRNWLVTLLAYFFLKLKPERTAPSVLDYGVDFGTPHSISNRPVRIPFEVDGQMWREIGREHANKVIAMAKEGALRG